MPTETMSNRTLHIGNLSFRATERDLNEAFSKYGEVIQVKMPKHCEGNPKGFAFVEMESREAANQAIREMHGLPFMGREELIVQLAREREGAPFTKKEHPEMREPPLGESRTLFIGNVERDATDDDLKELLTDAGFVPEHARVVRKPGTGASQCVAYAIFKTPDISQKAKETLDRKLFMGRPLRIRRAKDRENFS